MINHHHGIISDQSALITSTTPSMIEADYDRMHTETESFWGPNKGIRHAFGFEPCKSVTTIPIVCSCSLHRSTHYLIWWKWSDDRFCSTCFSILPIPSVQIHIIDHPAHTLISQEPYIPFQEFLISAGAISCCLQLRRWQMVEENNTNKELGLQSCTNQEDIFHA